MSGSSLLHPTFRPLPAEPLSYRGPAPQAPPQPASSERRSSATSSVETAPRVASPNTSPTPFAPSPAALTRSTPVAREPSTVQLSPLVPSAALGDPPTLRVHGAELKRVDIGDVRPGDIGFVYQRQLLSTRQKLIGLGERIVNAFRPWRRGSPHVLHAFIVVDTHPERRKLLIADAAAGYDMEQIELMVMDFKHNKRMPPAANYLFYRPNDPNLAKRIEEVARNWTYVTTGVNNFSATNAVRSTFHPAGLRSRSKKRALYFATQADHQGPLMRKDHPNYTYNMMCSEFVTNVCIAATLSLWQRSKQTAGEKADLNLTGLWEGPAGDTFAVDARGVPPSVLQMRLAKSSAIHTVGYIPANESFVGKPSVRSRMFGWAGSGQ